MTYLRTLLAFSPLLFVVNQAQADRIAAFPIPERVARADLVVVGKVTKIEKDALKLTMPWGGKQKQEHLVAVVKIAEGIKSDAKLTHVRVAFRAPPPPPPQGLVRRPIESNHLTLGEEVCLFLTAHPSEPVYQFVYYFDRIDKRVPKYFAQQVELARLCGKLLKEPAKSLASKNPRDRLLTAAMLLMEYRTTPRNRKPGSKIVQEPIDAALSRKILTALAEADWKRPIPELQPTHGPLNLFIQIGLTQADGWTPPKDFKKINDAAQAWLAKNAATYRIKKLVVVPPGK